MTNRRKFLALLGVGTASAPLAAKQAADELIAKQAGINLLGAAGVPSAMGDPGSYDFKTDVPYNQRYINIAEYVKMFGVPDFVKESYRLNSQWVDRLDPDIACKKSWSMSVKIMTQRERNYQNMIDGIDRNASHYRKKSVVEKILGFEWPW